MDSISAGNRINIPQNISAPTQQAKDEEASSSTTDSVDLNSSKDAVKSGGAGNWFTALLDIRRPTLTKEFTEEQRKEVLSLIQPGDIILETNDAYPGWQIFEKATLKSNFTHAAIYEGEGKFIEATTGDPSGKGVVRTDLEEYMHGRIQFQVVRPPYKTQEDREAALNYARSQLGKPYDADFVLEDESKIYCAELVERALKAMPNKIETPLVDVMGRKAVAPDAFQKIPGSEVVWTNKKGFIRSMLTHAPSWAMTAAAGIGGAMMFGPWGAVGGAVLGRVFSTLLGNYIQEGSFSYFPGK